MGIHAKLSAYAGSTGPDAAQLPPDELVRAVDPRAPVSGHVRRNGQLIPFTLDATNLAPEVHRVMPEQIAIAAVLLASFVAPIWRLLG